LTNIHLSSFHQEKGFFSKVTYDRKLNQTKFLWFNSMPLFKTTLESIKKRSILCYIYSSIFTLATRLVMGPDQIFFDQVESIFCCSGRISHLWFGFGKFPLKIPNFSIVFLLNQKNLFRSKVPGSKTGQPLIYCGSKVWSGQGPSLNQSCLKSNLFVLSTNACLV